MLHFIHYTIGLEEYFETLSSLVCVLFFQSMSEMINEKIKIYKSKRKTA